MKEIPDIAHRTVVVEHPHLAVLDAEEVDDFSWLKVAVGVFGDVTVEGKVDDQLVGDIIRGVAQSYWVPAVAFGHVAAQGCVLDGLKVRRFLVLILPPEELRLSL